MMREPLEALWETIGACGEPPRDDSMTFAAVGIALTAVAWFVTPVVVARLLPHAVAGSARAAEPPLVCKPHACDP